MAAARKNNSLERDWDPQKSVLVRNKSGHNILLELPTGYFRLDAKRSFRMAKDIVDLAQVQQLIASGQLEIDR